MRIQALGVRLAPDKYSSIRTRDPDAEQPSQAELDNLEASLQWYLEMRLEASWAATARGTDQVEGGERFDVDDHRNSVIVSVQVPVTRREAVYFDPQGRPLQYPTTQESQFIVSAQAQSVFDPQTRAWRGITRPTDPYHLVSLAPST